MNEQARILMVDDEERLLEMLSQLLKDNGYYVRTAPHHEAAIKLITNEAFDIAFIDQFLGDVKGIDLMKKMASFAPELAFVIITGSGTADLATEALKQGASDFLTKPFFLQDMIKSIDYVNKKKELEREKKELLLTLEAKIEEKTKALNNVYIHVLSSLANTMEKKDTGTYGHSMRVSNTSARIAAALDLSNRDRETLHAASILHDIGKIGTSDFILGKPGPLDEHEMNIIRAHPHKGVEILSPLQPIFGQMSHILPAILHHHERYDGSGYPAGLSGDKIPLFARIISIADTYDAIISNRPYREASSHERALREISDHAGSQFDRKIVEAFVSLHENNMQPIASFEG